jgi:collagen type IV alpha
MKISPLVLSAFVLTLLACGGGNESKTPDTQTTPTSGSMTDPNTPSGDVPGVTPTTPGGPASPGSPAMGSSPSGAGAPSTIGTSPSSTMGPGSGSSSDTTPPSTTGTGSGAGPSATDTTTTPGSTGTKTDTKKPATEKAGGKK